MKAVERFFRFNNNYKPPFVVMDSHTETALDDMRTTLRGLIWPGGFPSTGKDSITTGVTSPLLFNAANLATVDRLTFQISGITDRQPYLFNPTISNGKLIIWHFDHFYAATGTDIFELFGRANTIRNLINAGYTVCEIHMPPGTNPSYPTEGAVHSYPISDSHYDSIDDFHYFLDCTIRVINELYSSYTEVNMIGFSGGGWTTCLMGAIDERITTSIIISGSLPEISTEEAGMLKDWEQHLPGLLSYVEYVDLYLMAATNNRTILHMMGYDEISPGFNFDTYNLYPYSEYISLFTENYDLHWDMDTTLHEVTYNEQRKINSVLEAQSVFYEKSFNGTTDYINQPYSSDHRTFSFIIKFKTGSDITSTQTLFDRNTSGGNINILLIGSKLAVYHTTVSPSEAKIVSLTALTIQTNTTYIACMVIAPTSINFFVYATSMNVGSESKAQELGFTNNIRVGCFLSGSTAVLLFKGTHYYSKFMAYALSQSEFQDFIDDGEDYLPYSIGQTVKFQF